MKTLTLIGAILVSGNVYAQESAASATKSDLEFSGSVMAGVRSFLNGRLDGQGQEDGQRVGPFIRPSLSLDYKNSKMSINAVYEFETTGARGFGNKDENGNAMTRNFGGNAYFKHNPNMTFTGNFNDTFGTRVIADLVFKTYNGPQSENVSELALEPMLSAKINNSLTILAGYSYFREHNIDAATGRGASIGESGAYAVTNTNDIEKTFESIATDLVPKVNNRHVGKLELEAKLTEDTKLITYAWAGRRLYAQGNAADRFTYRLNVDLKTKPVKDLSLSLRYRYNFDDKDNAANGAYHLGRVIASYNLTKAIAINLENEAIFIQGTFDSPVTYENENFVGLSYSF